MSRKGGKSDKLDRYYTPAWAARLLARLGVEAWFYGSTYTRSLSVLEPSSGTGSLVRAVRREAATGATGRAPICDVTVTTCEIDPDAPRPEGSNRHFSGDFLEWAAARRGMHRYDLCVANPPYTIARDFIDECNRCCDVVVMLLRFGFLASEKRTPFFQEHPPSEVWIYPNRPSFTGGADATDYAAIVWDNRLTVDARRSVGARLRWFPIVPLSERKT